MSNLFTLETAILCEHLVQGLNNKYTAINMYAGNIMVKEFPGQIPIAIYLELNPKSFGKSLLELKLFLGKKEIMSGSAEALFEEGKLAVIAIPTGFIALDKPTTFKMTLGNAGEKPITLLRKKIFLNSDLDG